MPTFYEPGKPKNNNTWVARGRIIGKQYEIVTDAKNKSAARHEWREFETAVRNRDGHRAQKEPTFTDAITEYRQFANPRPAEMAFIEKLEKYFKGWPVAGVTHADIARAANDLYPGRANATKNRQVYTPMGAILHYASEIGMRDYLVVRKLPQTKPARRRPATGTIDKLLKNTDGYQHLFLSFIYYQGWRISETLHLRWNETGHDSFIDLSSKVFVFYIPKADAWKVLPIHDRVFILLVSLPANERRGKVFPWACRSSVYSWLNPLCDKLKVKFTPHQARHEWATVRNEDQCTAADMVSANTWTSERSVAGYTEVTIDHARSVLNRGKSQKIVYSRGKSRGRQSK